MIVENIKRLPDGSFSCNINGLRINGEVAFINKILKDNNLPIIQTEPQHWSCTKNCWMPIKDMTAKHIENHLIKERLFDKESFYWLHSNYDNCRDYLRRLIELYDNYDKK